MPISINMNKAREIVRLMIRSKRAVRFTELDLEFQFAVENAKSYQHIVDEKKRLRGLPQDLGIVEARTIDELKQVGDNILSSIVLKGGEHESRH